MKNNIKRRDRYINSSLERAKKASNVHELRMCLSILLVNRLGCTAKESAEIIGVGLRTLPRLREEFAAISVGKKLARENWGGRRHSYLSEEEENKFILPFAEKAKTGELVITASIGAAFEQKIGKKVPLSTISRLLARHQWRKLEPEPCHPKEDKAAQEEFKKKALPKKWGRPPVFWFPPVRAG